MGFKALKQQAKHIDNFQVFINGKETNIIFQKRGSQYMLTILKQFDKYATKSGFRNTNSSNGYIYKNINNDLMELRLI